MRLYLESQDLFEHVDGTAETPEGKKMQKRCESLTVVQRKRTYICLAIEPGQPIHVRETKTANEAWHALKNQFSLLVFFRSL